LELFSNPFFWASFPLGWIIIFVAYKIVSRMKKFFIQLDERVEKLEHPMHTFNPEPILNFASLESVIEELPQKVLKTIQGSVNTKEGVLGELVAHLQLRSEYDRLIAMNSISDFIGIRFPKTVDDVLIPGRIDFIDVKTGKSARLSKDQKEFRNIIRDKHINFITLKVSK